MQSINPVVRFCLRQTRFAVTWLRHSRLERAQTYVGNPGKRAGEMQLELLKLDGCLPSSSVLEVGCGVLLAGIPIMRYLQPEKYVGIEPNRWLIRAALADVPGARQLAAEKRPIFVATESFDASSCGRMFDYVISHSVLSHAAAWQLPQFLGNVRRVLKTGGVVIASIRFHDDAGHLVGDSNDTSWVYPCVSYFSWDTVAKLASQHGYEAEWRVDYQERFQQAVPSNTHDWIRLTAV
jgi:SAM-dependent methyltransferase